MICNICSCDWQIAFIFCIGGGGGLVGGLRTMENPGAGCKKGLGKSRKITATVSLGNRRPQQGVG